MRVQLRVSMLCQKHKRDSPVRRAVCRGLIRSSCLYRWEQITLLQSPRGIMCA